jgi:hypothetical protein
MLQSYWSRGWTGIRWRRRFPDSPKVEIRRFLDFFIEAFGFPMRRVPVFRRTTGFSTSITPPGDALADCMELETSASDIQKHYDVDLASVWQDDITLGELYARIHKVA